MLQNFVLSVGTALLLSAAVFLAANGSTKFLLLSDYYVFLAGFVGWVAGEVLQ